MLESSFSFLFLGICYACTTTGQTRIYKKLEKRIRLRQVNETIEHSEDSFLSTFIYFLGLGWNYGTKLTIFSFILHAINVGKNVTKSIPWIFESGLIRRGDMFSIFHSSISYRMIGYVLLLIGIYIQLSSMNELDLNWDYRSQTRKNHQLITTKFYGYVRHPVYLGLILQCIAHILFGVDSFFTIICRVSLTIFALMKIPNEEKILIEQFGQSYEDYRQKIPAFLPKSLKSYKLNS